MVSLRAETEDIHAKALAVQQQAGDIETQLGTLSQKINDLYNTWQGSAASAFHDLYHNWQIQATNMRQALEGIGRALSVVGTDYEDLERQIASKLR